MKCIISACPIHPGCSIQVVFGDDANERIPFPDPALKPIAERDFPELVPIQAEHHMTVQVPSTLSQRGPRSPLTPSQRVTGQPIQPALGWSERRPVKRVVLTIVVMFVLAASGIATAAVLAGAKDNKAEGNEQDAGIHGGRIERFHSAGSCDLVAVSSLPGNWTHGDYVSAVAANGSPAQIQQAAHSDCGKPMDAVGHGGGPPEHAGGPPEHAGGPPEHAGGPPEHAGEHMAAGKAHAGGNAEDKGSGTSGS